MCYDTLSVICSRCSWDRRWFPLFIVATVWRQWSLILALTSENYDVRGTRAFRTIIRLTMTYVAVSSLPHSFLSGELHNADGLFYNCEIYLALQSNNDACWLYFLQRTWAWANYLLFSKMTLNCKKTFNYKNYV